MTNWNNVLAVLIKSLLWLYFSSYNYKYSNFLKKSNIDQIFFLEQNVQTNYITNIRIIFDINKFLTKKYYMKYII